MRRVILTRQAERTVVRRVFALSFSCVGLVILLALGFRRGLVSPRGTAVGLVTVTVALGVGALLVTKSTIRELGASAWSSGMPMDVATRRRLVLRIRAWNIAIVVLGLSLILGLVRG